MEIFQALRVISVLGFNLAGTMLVGFFVGRFMDLKLGTGPYFAALGLLFGTAIAFRKLWQIAKRGGK